jgi:hypothetical protein
MLIADLSLKDNPAQNDFSGTPGIHFDTSRVFKWPESRMKPSSILEPHLVQVMGLAMGERIKN